jgi:hypothetical protein
VGGAFRQDRNRFTNFLADVLQELRSSGVLRKLEEVDDAATLAHYRQEREDPELRRISYEYSKKIIETDSDDRQRLEEFVRDVEEERGLWGTWDWMIILLNGLIGQQRLVFKTKQAREKPSDTRVAEGMTPKRGGKQVQPRPFVDHFKRLAWDWREIADGRGRRDRFFEHDHLIRFLHRRLEELTGLPRKDFEDAAYRINAPIGLGPFQADARPWWQGLWPGQTRSSAPFQRIQPPRRAGNRNNINRRIAREISR